MMDSIKFGLILRLFFHCLYRYPKQRSYSQIMLKNMGEDFRLLVRFSIGVVVYWFSSMIFVGKHTHCPLESVGEHPLLAALPVEIYNFRLDEYLVS